MHEVFRLGPFDFDATVLRLYRGGVSVDVEPRPLEVLAELIRDAGQVVSKNDLLDRVWANRVVTESVLTRCINQLRAALDDEHHTLVLTVHGYGYRYTGEVERLDRLPVHLPSQPTDWRPEPDGVFPGRPQWRLVRALDTRMNVWLVQHRKTGERHAVKFALDAPRLSALKRELTLHRTLQRLLPERDGFARLLDCNFESPPFFVELEYHEHGSLADWFAAGGADALSRDERVSLIADAAEVLAAAHSVGVLHLDAKPSNLLVWMDGTGRPRVRWTDFGSGQLLEPERLAQLEITRLGLTEAGSSAGHGTTPLYVAPEVLAGQQPAAPADIYALGVMLFQLVVGDLRRPMAPGWEQDVDDELLREDIAVAAHGTTTKRLPSAADLAARLRALPQRRAERAAQRALVARSAALQEQLQRARARRPWVVAACITLSVGLAASAYFYQDAVRARDDAREQAAIAEAVTHFFNEGVLGAASSYQIDYRPDLTVREAVERAVAKLDQGFTGSPLAEAAIRERLGALYLQNADLPRAADQYRRAVAAMGAGGAAGTEDAIRLEYMLAAVLVFGSRFDEAAAMLERLEALLDGSPELASTLGGLRDGLRATYHRQRGEYDLVVPYSERLLASTFRGQPDPMAAALRRYTVGLDYARVGRFTESDAQFKLAFEGLAASGDVSGALTALAQGAYGAALIEAGRHAEARDVLERAVATLSESHGPRSESTADARMHLCRALGALGETGAAAAHCRAAHEIYVERFGAESHFTANAARYLAALDG